MESGKVPAKLLQRLSPGAERRPFARKGTGSVLKPRQTAGWQHSRKQRACQYRRPISDEIADWAAHRERRQVIAEGRVRARGRTKVHAVAQTSAGQGREPLSPRQIRECRGLLEERRGELVRDLQDLGREFSGLLPYGIGRAPGPSIRSSDLADSAHDSVAAQLNAELINGTLQELGEINEALGRIEKGTCGVCLGTGKPIGIARLRARPWARYCIKYARQLEERRRMCSPYSRVRRRRRRMRRVRLNLGETPCYPEDDGRA